jgi:diguanylate cyclase (GGDEF)-like protein
MSEHLAGMMFWLVLPALALGRRRLRRASWALFAAAPLGALAAGLESAGFPPEAWGAGLVAALAGAALLLARDFSRRADHRVGVRLRGLRGETREIRRRVLALEREAEARHGTVERLQNRFALVQGMATRLDTDVLLQSLGRLWSDVRGVRRVLLAQRRSNGNWAVAFAQGVPAPENWIGLLENHPELAEGRRLRKCLKFDKFPFLKDAGVEPPFFLVPIAWGEDLMAIGCVETAPDLSEEGESGFDTERKLVSIGLRRAHLYDLMSERSRHDGLTGTLLRRTFMERLQGAARQSRRYKAPLFAAVFDIDRFKAINDTFGHPVGDKALVETARIVRDHSVPGVTLGRLGGDEFGLVLEMATREEAVAWLERLRAAVEASSFSEEGKDVRFTLSIGVAEFRAEESSAESFLARADQALYEAKRLGRNRVAIGG